MGEILTVEKFLSDTILIVSFIEYPDSMLYTMPFFEGRIDSKTNNRLGLSKHYHL